MLEKIAMWGGIAGVAVALFAIIILFLTKQSINHILNKDKILFDQNFELKHKAINLAMSVADDVANYGNAVKNNAEYRSKANKAYNDLLCVLSDERISDEFYNIAIDPNFAYNEARIINFKLICRRDIGLKIKKSRAVERALTKQQNMSAGLNSQPQTMQKPTPQQPRPVQQVRPVQPKPVAQPVKPGNPGKPNEDLF